MPNFLKVLKASPVLKKGDAVFYRDGDDNPTNVGVHEPLLKGNEGDSSISAEYVKDDSEEIRRLFE